MAASAVDLVIVHRDNPVAVLAHGRAGSSPRASVPRIVVVDNGSAARGAATAVRAGLPPGVALIEAGANTGFGPGANVGFRWFLAHDPAPWLAVCPHDADPLPGCLERLVAVAAAQPRAGLASADVGDGLTPMVDRYFGAIPAPATVVDGWEPAGYPHGTLMLARRECLRGRSACSTSATSPTARRPSWPCGPRPPAGRSGVVRGAEVRNTDVGSRAAVVDYLQLRNTLLMVREHSGRYHATIRLAHRPVAPGRRALVPARRGPYWAPRARLLAIAHHLRGRYGPPPVELFRPAAERSAPQPPASAAATLGPDPHQVDARHHQAHEHRQRPEQDGGQPHHPAPPGERPGPLGPAGRVEERPRGQREQESTLLTSTTIAVASAGARDRVDRRPASERLRRPGLARRRRGWRRPRSRAAAPATTGPAR